jgi:hypothetical protein
MGSKTGGKTEKATKEGETGRKENTGESTKGSKGKVGEKNNNGGGELQGEGFGKGSRFSSQKLANSASNLLDSTSACIISFFSRTDAPYSKVFCPTVDNNKLVVDKEAACTGTSGGAATNEVAVTVTAKGASTGGTSLQKGLMFSRICIALSRASGGWAAAVLSAWTAKGRGAPPPTTGVATVSGTCSLEAILSRITIVFFEDIDKKTLTRWRSL